MSDTTQVNGYELHEKLGSGGFGAVYRAYQPTVGREVAIKIILPHHASRPEFVRRFEVEAQVIARLEHMNIVPLYDYWRDPDGAYLVMRYMRGGSLRQMIKQAPFNPPTAVVLVEQMAGALAIAHRNGVIHRDLKPENVLLDEDGNAYLGDFGIAKNLAILDSHTDTGDVIGSPGYLAPEQARGETVAPQTDVYSLGVMLYEILCGEHPFPNTNPVEKIYKHLNEPLPLLSNLAPEVEVAINDVIQKATSKNPRHRFENVIAFAEAFRQAAAIERDSSDVAVEMLTPREQQVLHYIIAGKSNRQIAETLVVEVSTVKWYIKQIYRKLNVHNRVQAIVRGRELNLVVGDEDKGDHTYLSTYYELPDVKNPYKGLRAFETVDSDDFFGRDKLIKKLVSRLDVNKGAKGGRFLAVVGPSGSGKSSVVKAGLIPALWRGDLPGSENWYVAEVLPGPRPLDELEIALTRLAPNNSINLREQLERDEHGLLRAAQLILPDDGSELLVVIDQFEEVFTLVEDETRRQQFLDLIQAAVTDQRSLVRVVITLRADFYDRPLQYPHLGDLMREHMETVLPLSAEELQQVILKPADKLGIRFEEGLVARIIGDVNYQPGSLPLLQYALTELFDRRDGRTITQDAHTKIGGTVGALAKRADELFAEFDEDGQEAIRQMFMRLITLGEGTEDTRRRVQRSELLSVSEDTDLMDDVVDSFAGYRLLALDNDPTTREPTVEVAHEAILREWERLRGWLNDSRDDIKTQRQLSTLAAEWESHQRSNDYLVRGTRLQHLQAWSAETSLTLTPAEKAFLDASIAERQQREAKEQAQAEREANLQLRARRILQGLVAVFLFAAIGGGSLAYWANQQRIRAEQEEQKALRQASIGLAALAEKELEGTNPERGVLLALEALENYPYTPQALEALARSVEGYRDLRLFDGSHSVADRLNIGAWSPDGRLVAVGSSPAPNSVIIWETETGEEVLSVDNHGEFCEDTILPRIHELAWSPDGKRIATIAIGNPGVDDCSTTVVIWDTTTGATVQTLTKPPELGNIANRVNWSPDGKELLVGYFNGTVSLLDVATWTERLTLTGHGDQIIYEANWSPDGDQIVTTAGDQTIRIWDANTGEQLFSLSGHTGRIWSVAWSQDGTRIASGGDDTLLRIWDVEIGNLIDILPGHTGAILNVDWSSDGKILSRSIDDRSIKVWDASTGSFLYQLSNFTPRFARFSPEGDRVFTSDFNKAGHAYIWDLSNATPTLVGHRKNQDFAGWSPDGELIATAVQNNIVRIFDAGTLELLTTFRLPSAGGRWGHWSFDSTRLVIPTTVNTFGVWDVSTGEELLELLSPEFIPLMAGWSPDGSYIAGSGWQPEAQLNILVWDAQTGETTLTIQTDDPCRVWWPTFSPDSTKVVHGCMIHESPNTDTPAFIWDIETGEQIMELESSDLGWTIRAEWSPDGARILTSYEHGVVRIWDAETEEMLLTYAGHLDQVWAAAWSPDGKRVASGDLTGLVKIWNAETGEDLASFGVPGTVSTINWAPDGKSVIVAGEGFREPIIRRVWEKDELMEYARACCVTRELTPEERRHFGLPDRE